MKQQQYNTALYMRLSCDDELEGESASFKRMIEDIEEENQLRCHKGFVKAWQELWGICHLRQFLEELSLSKADAFSSRNSFLDVCVLAGTAAKFK